MPAKFMNQHIQFGLFSFQYFSFNAMRGPQGVSCGLVLSSHSASQICTFHAERNETFMA